MSTTTETPRYFRHRYPDGHLGWFVTDYKLGREEARHRLDSGLARLRPELAGLVSTLDYSWEGDRLNFQAGVMWQTITGGIEVLDDAIRIEIDLPWMMQLLADTITKQVRGRGLAMLEKPPGES